MTRQGDAGSGESGRVRGPAPGGQLIGRVFDVVFFLCFLLVLPVLLVVMAVLCIVPFVDYLLNPRREYLDGVSAAFINLLPEGVIHGLLVSEHRVTSDVALAAFKKTYLCKETPEFARMYQTVVKSPFCWPYWTEATQAFDIDRHLHAVAKTTTKAELEEFVGRVQREPFKPGCPLWEFYHFENFVDEDGMETSACVLRLHHGMCDGFAFLRWMMAACEPKRPPPMPAKEEKQSKGPKTSPWQLIMGFLAAFRKLLMMSQDLPSVYKSTKHLNRTSPRVTAWNRLRSANVDALKQLGKKLDNATVNDLLLTALSGALKRYQKEANCKVPGEVTTCMWAALAPLKDAYADWKDKPFRWGNSTLGAVYLKIPIGDRYADYDVRDTLRTMRAITADPSLRMEAVAATATISVFGWIPRVFAEPLWKVLANKVTVSMSNVPGPQFRFSWCAVPAKYMSFFVPPAGTLSVFATIFTCNGEVAVGMGADGSLFDTDTLRRITSVLFEDEVAHMLKQADLGSTDGQK